MKNEKTNQKTYNGQTQFCNDCNDNGGRCNKPNCKAFPKEGWTLPPTTEWKYNPLTGEPHDNESRIKSWFTMWQTWVIIILAFLVVLSFATATDDYRSRINDYENQIKANKTKITNYKNQFNNIENQKIKPLVEKARKLEIQIDDIKAKRKVEVEAPAQKLKRDGECLRLKIDFMKKYKTLATDEVCKTKTIKGNEARAETTNKPLEPNLALARAVAQAEGNGINKTNPCNIRDFKTGKFKVFTDREEGIRNCHNIFVKYTAVNPNVDILGAIKTFSPSSDNNNPKQHASNIIYILADKYKVSADYTTKITDLLKI